MSKLKHRIRLYNESKKRFNRSVIPFHNIIMVNTILEYSRKKVENTLIYISKSNQNIVFNFILDWFCGKKIDFFAIHITSKTFSFNYMPLFYVENVF